MFLWLVSYNIGLLKILGIQVLCLPLTELVRKDKPFEWNQSQESAICDLTEPVLKYPEYTRLFVVHTDAWGTAIGTVLLQVYKGQENPVASETYELKKRGT